MTVTLAAMFLTLTALVLWMTGRCIHRMNRT